MTIFGESAGGISVSMLSASPKAKGLFQRAISQSGGSMAPIRYATEAGQEVYSLKLAEANGRAFLNKLGATDLTAARALSADVIQKGGVVTGMFRPTADGETIVGDQYELFEAGTFNDTPILVGTNSDDGAMFVHPSESGAAFDQQIRNDYAAAAEGILKAYPHATIAEAARSSKEVFREALFAWPTWVWAKLQSRHGKSKAFVYYFDYYHSDTSLEGAAHGAELPYVFGNWGRFGGFGEFDGEAPTSEDIKMSELMMSYWVNFAATGDPNGPGLPVWPTFDEKEQLTLFLDEMPAAHPHPDVEKLGALDAYYAWRREQAKAEQ